jgi:DNA-binding response OmpR family regulator
LLRRTLPPSFDLVLLDVLMPELDGYRTLACIKADATLAHVPVIMISAVDEMESVIRCIKLGATDYLPKPFNAALLQARISASLAGKRLRDLELEYLEQVGDVTAAAAAVESGTFASADLERVAARADGLGQLARVFTRMACEVRLREERLRREVSELRIEIDHARQAEKVTEITETEYFRRVRDQAGELRRIIDGFAEQGGAGPTQDGDAAQPASQSLGPTRIHPAIYEFELRGAASGSRALSASPRNGPLASCPGAPSCPGNQHISPVCQTALAEPLRSGTKQIREAGVKQATRTVPIFGSHPRAIDL